MKIGVLGTGTVGQAIASKLTDLGHTVMMGSRTADNAKAAEWVSKNGALASQGTFAQAARFGELIFNCSKGEATLGILEMAGPSNLEGKILIDISNPLDFSKGMPPTLSIVNDTSLGEEVQKMLPGSKVVKTLNTLTAALMVNPSLVNNGDHDIFLSGNDKASKEKVRSLLQSFGWSIEHI
ncbi:MAG: NAD(P)-binding domain-containing protein, partial [Bacteroidia bacterium]|nr:NAD(P)-binding domain-containing protein [Bacteroidia bacterium]